MRADSPAATRYRAIPATLPSSGPCGPPSPWRGGLCLHQFRQYRILHDHPGGGQAEHLSVPHGVPAVSYTHLDVYKRQVKDFTSINPKSFRHVNFNVRKGEILGVAGLVGAQRTELMEGLFGLRCHTSGTITYKGKELTINQPQDAIKNGIAMLTEDRRATGILGVLSIADNVSIASLNKYLIGGIMLDDNKSEKLVQDKMCIRDRHWRARPTRSAPPCCATATDA